MTDFASVTRWDLEQDHTPEPRNCTMERSRRGDYVEWSDYKELLDAYEDLKAKHE